MYPIRSGKSLRRSAVINALKKELITFPDGTSRYVASKLRIGAVVDDRQSNSLLGPEPEPARYPGPSVMVQSPSGNYREHRGIESAEHWAARNYALTAILIFISACTISQRFFPGFHHLPKAQAPIWVTVERA